MKYMFFNHDLQITYKPWQEHGFWYYLECVCYYLEGFHFGFPCHTLVSCIRKITHFYFFVSTKVWFSQPYVLTTICIILLISITIVRSDMVGFISWQNLRSYQGWYQLVTVRTHVKLYCATPRGNHAASNMAWYPTQSQYPVTELSNPFIILPISCNRVLRSTH